MANSLLVKLGFSADRQSITGTIDGIGSITSAVSDLQKKNLSKLSPLLDCKHLLLE